MFDLPWGRGAAFAEFALYVAYTILALRAALTAPSTGERFRKRIQAVGVNMVIASTALYSLISTGDIFFFAGTLLGFLLFALSTLWKGRFHPEPTAVESARRKRWQRWPALTPVLIGLTLVNAYLLSTAWSPLYSPFVAIDVAVLALLWLFVPLMLARLDSMLARTWLKYTLILLTFSVGLEVTAEIAFRIFYWDWLELDKWLMPIGWFYRPVGEISRPVLSALEIPSFYPTPHREQAIMHLVGALSLYLWLLLVGLVLACARGIARTVFRKLTTHLPGSSLA